MNRILRYSMFVIPVGLVLAFMPSLSARQGAQKTIFVSVLDAKGVPVKDLKQDELRAAEDGKEVQVASAKLSTQPLSIVLLADTSKVAGSGGIAQTTTSGAGEPIRDIRAALSAVNAQVHAESPDSELAMMEFGQASIMMTDFTKSAAEFEKNIPKLFPKPDADSVLLEAILESAKQLEKRPNARRAIIAINIEPGNEQSREPANNILKELAKAHAAIFSVSLQFGTNQNQSRGIVLDGLTKNTGGKRDFIVGQSALVNLVKSYVDILLSQYEVTYTRTANAPQVVQVGTTRPGMTLLASRFPPQ